MYVAELDSSLLVRHQANQRLMWHQQPFDDPMSYFENTGFNGLAHESPAVARGLHAKTLSASQTVPHIKGAASDTLKAQKRQLRERGQPLQAFNHALRTVKAQRPQPQALQLCQLPKLSKILQLRCSKRRVRLTVSLVRLLICCNSCQSEISFMDSL